MRLIAIYATGAVKGSYINDVHFKVGEEIVWLRVTRHVKGIEQL